jgi:hypothetical protein
VTLADIELPWTTGTIRHRNREVLYYRARQYAGRLRGLRRTRNLHVLGIWGSVLPQQLNLPYLIEGPRSADLQSVSRPWTFWKHFSARYDARLEILTIPPPKPPFSSYSWRGISYTRPVQPFIRCGQLRQNLVCMRTTWTSIHRMTHELSIGLDTLTCTMLTGYFSLHHMQ